MGHFKRNAGQDFAILESQVNIAQRDKRLAGHGLYFLLRRLAQGRTRRIRGNSGTAERRDVARHASDYRWKPADSSGEFRTNSRNRGNELIGRDTAAAATGRNPRSARIPKK